MKELDLNEIVWKVVKEKQVKIYFREGVIPLLELEEARTEAIIMAMLQKAIKESRKNEEIFVETRRKNDNVCLEIKISVGKTKFKIN